MKRLVYLISPNKINKNFFKDLNKVLSFNNVKFFQLRLKNVKNNKILKITKKLRKITDLNNPWSMTFLNNEEITKEELDTANKQFSDLLKSLGLAGVFALPGGLLAIALLVKVGHKLGIEIIPDKYRK